MNLRQMTNRWSATMFIGLGFLAVPGLQAADDLVIADFEGTDYGAWKAAGTAFGPGPAQGTLPGQMPVSGFAGKRLVNSFFLGDGSTGTLTSPEFKIDPAGRFWTRLTGLTRLTRGEKIPISYQWEYTV